MTNKSSHVGPSLPHDVSTSSMVTSPNKMEVRLIGGGTTKTTYSSDIFVLMANYTEWKKSNQSLVFGRRNHFALPYTIKKQNRCS